MKGIIVDRDSDQPLYAQIRDALLAAVEGEVVKPGDRLPPVAVLAREIGVTQATIRRALEDLTNAGVVGCHVGRGTFVKERKAKNEGKARPVISHWESVRNRSSDRELTLAAKRQRMGMAKSLDDLMELARRPGLIQFASGLPDPSLVRDGVLEELTLDALKAGQNSYQGYSQPMGLLDLRRELSRRFVKGGLPVEPEQILITSGSQQAVAVLAQVALENRQRVVCEVPCYKGVYTAFGALGHWVESIPRDAEGPLPDQLDRFRDGQSSLLYFCPELHHPMGTDIVPERRRNIIDWAREQNSLLVADEIFRDLRFEGPSPASFLTEAGADLTVEIGSLSKSFMCGLRIGWLVSSPERVRSIIGLKRAMDIGCPPLMEGIALSLLRSGEYDEHLSRVRRRYRTRRDIVLEALERCMPDGVAWSSPLGGFHMWVELPPGYSSIALFLLAIERGVAIIPGPKMDIDHRFVNAFRLSYGSIREDRIEEGIELLAGAVEDLLKQPPGEPDLGGLGDYV